RQTDAVVRAMERKRVLIFGGETNPYHDFDAQGPVLAEIAHNAGFDAECTRDEESFRPEKIKPFDAIVIAASSGKLSAEGEENLLNAVIGNPWGNTGSPKGLYGFHGATVLTSDSGKYQRVIGARFLTHPPIGPAYNFRVIQKKHPVMRGVRDFNLADELYLMEHLSAFDVILSSGYEGFERPIAWVKPYGLGRICYCALGHSVEQLEDDHLRQIISNALGWLTGKRN
ncbi:MAG TPA: ThuA domain-containing protein, partial [Spirochaetota bacterium]